MTKKIVTLLLALGAAQTGLVLALEGPMRRLLDRTRVWAATVLVKALEAGAGRSLWIDFGGRAATMTQTPAGEFGADIVTALNSSHVAAW